MDKLKKVLSGPDNEDQGSLAEAGLAGGDGTFLKLRCQDRKLSALSCYRSSLLPPGQPPALAAKEGLALRRFTPPATPHPLGAFLAGPMEQLQRRLQPVGVMVTIKCRCDLRSPRVLPVGGLTRGFPRLLHAAVLGLAWHLAFLLFASDAATLFSCALQNTPPVLQPWSPCGWIPPSPLAHRHVLLLLPQRVHGTPTSTQQGGGRHLPGGWPAFPITPFPLGCCSPGILVNKIRIKQQKE